MGGISKAFQAQGGVEGLLSSPNFRAGIGLLSPQPGQTGIEGLLSGAASAQEFKDKKRKQDQQKKLEKEIARIMAAQQGQAAPPVGPPGTPAGAPQPPQVPQTGPSPGISGPVQQSPNDPGALIQQAPPINAPSGPGAPPPSPGSAQQAASAPNSLQELSNALLQFGTPQQQQAALSQMAQQQRFEEREKTAQERYQDEVRREQDRFEGQKKNRRVRATRELGDGRFINIYDSGEAEVVTVDGDPVTAGANQQVVKNADGSVDIINKRTGEVSPLRSQEAATESRITADTARQQAKGETADQLQARKALPNIRVATDQTLKIVDQIRNSSGRAQSTGTVQGAIPDFLRVTPGMRNFDAMIEQLEGKVFLTAFESLKGGGTITEIEGIKAQQALARLKKSQTDEAFLTALDDFESAVRQAQAVAEDTAAGGTQQAIDRTDSLSNRQYTPEQESMLQRYEQ